jgi:hypothetical protein
VALLAPTGWVEYGDVVKKAHEDGFHVCVFRKEAKKLSLRFSHSSFQGTTFWHSLPAKKE